MHDSLSKVERKRGVYRIAVAALFFLQGLCFATWASRIPSIQHQLHISDKLLGVLLLALPAGSMIALFFSGVLVTRYGSKKIVTIGLILYALMLPLIGYAVTVTMLMITLVFFGMAGNVSNIAMNTQAVQVEARYTKSIMASFHGLWSVAGFSAASIGNYMMGKNILPFHHFLLIMAIILLGLAICLPFLMPDTKQTVTKTRFFAKPEKSLVRLGLIAFCCMLCEGAMFDWSGIYFQKVVLAEKGWIGAGYTAFMFTMASGRFVADAITSRLGFYTTITISGILIATGLCIAVLFPTLIPSIVGFFIVGFGVSSVIPLLYGEAGKLQGTAPGMALTAVSSIGFIGFVIGAPFIGIIAGTYGLRVSFGLIAMVGLVVGLLAYLSKKQTQYSFA